PGRRRAGERGGGRRRVLGRRKGLIVTEPELDGLPDEEAAPASRHEIVDRTEHLSKAEGAVLRADDGVAGYLPGVNILNGADLYVHQGELVGIIGPNGAGKSTLLKAMFGLVNIRSGTVTLRGEEITNLKAHALVERGIGFVPQTNNVFAA